MKLFAKIRNAINSPPQDRMSEVDARWAATNAEKRAEGCPCGGPAEVCTSYPTAGTIRAEFWTCRKHQDADGWSYCGDEPPIPHYSTDTSCGQCVNCAVLAKEPRMYAKWMCLTHPGDRKNAPDGVTDDGRPYWM